MKKFDRVCFIVFISIFFNILLSYASYELEENFSIQGKSYSDRNNGIYDIRITNQQVEDFLNKLKFNIASENIENLANMFNYPFNCNYCKKPTIIKTKVEFKKRYKEILTKHVKNAINDSSLERLFVNYQGFMIGDGEVWFTPVEGIKALN